MAAHSRRTLLSVVATSVVSLTGCSDTGAPTTTRTTRRATNTDTDTPSKTRTKTPTEKPTDTPTPEETPREAACDRRWNPEIRWSIRTEVRAYRPTVVDGTVYFGSQDGHLYAVDPVTGTVRWRAEKRGTLNGMPTAGNGVVVYAGYDRVAAFDASTGRERWSFSPPGEHSNLSWTIGDDGDTVYVGASQHPSPEIYVDTQYDRVYALDRRTGERRWRIALEPIQERWMVPQYVVARGGRVYVMVDDSPLVALDASDGTERWRRYVGRSPEVPVVAGDTVYTVGDGVLQALDARTGRTEWRDRGGDSPTVSDGVVYCPGYGIVQALDATDGRHLWEARLADDACADEPLRSGDTLYVPTGCFDGHGRLYAYDVNSGCRLGSFEVHSAGPTTPVVADDTVFVGGLNGEGRMWAISAP